MTQRKMLNNEPDAIAELALRTGTHSQQVPLNEWDRLPEETAIAYEAFLVYRDQEASRRLSDVATLLNDTLATVTRWSTRWNWEARCHAFYIARDWRESKDSTRESH